MTVVVVGPTAVGKSFLAVGLAQRLMAEGQPAEIVNADSMLVYRGMNIGTAKPTEEERAGVVHHLIDVLDVTETATVADFQVMARQAISDCRSRGVVPVVVGGSALYVRAIVDDFEFPGTDQEVRGALEAELAEHGPEHLYRRLAGQDQAAADQIGPGNGRRIVRALEVITLTGRPYGSSLPDYRYHLPDVVQVGLTADRAIVDQRIADRVDRMWADGFVDEVRALERSGLREGVTASRALGYRQILLYLDGTIVEDEAARQTVSGTRRFSRKQGGWFNKDPRIQWLQHESPDLLEDCLRLVQATVEDDPVEDSAHA